MRTSLLFKLPIDGNLSGYDKKKYVCKLLYMYILGWDIDFGHMEAVNLISSPKYSEKQIVSLVQLQLSICFFAGRRGSLVVRWLRWVVWIPLFIYSLLFLVCSREN